MTAEEAEQQRLDLIRSYHVCFMDEGGMLKPEAVEVFRHMLKMAGWPKLEAIADPNLLLVREGASLVVCSVLRMLNLNPENALIAQQLQDHDYRY